MKWEKITIWSYENPAKNGRERIELREMYSWDNSITWADTARKLYMQKQFSFILIKRRPRIFIMDNNCFIVLKQHKKEWNKPKHHLLLFDSAKNDNYVN